jgi:hypothetical protein
VLDIAAQVCGRTFDMASVHRFTDPEYADLSVRMPRGQNPALLFDRLNALGLILVHPSIQDLHTAIARSARDGDAVTTATNDEARALNTAIRDVRARRGEVDDVHVSYGSDGLAIGAGDVIATRRNHAGLGVANRQTWTVLHVTTGGEVWARETGTAHAHRRTVHLPAEYVAEHTHLAYAATSYGAQGATTPASHTVLGDGLDGAGMYVGMTRGRHRNTLHIVAADLDDAREQFTTALRRDRADRGLIAATRTAREAVNDLVPHGPVAFVNTELARLREWIRTADQEAARWEQGATALTRQATEHHTEYEQQDRIAADADDVASRLRAEVAAPLIDQATADGTAYLNARAQMWQANRALHPTGRFARRTATRTARDATKAHATAEDAMRRRWGDVPQTEVGLCAWAEGVAGQRADTDPRVIQAQQDAAQAHQQLRDLTAHHADARAELRRSVSEGPGGAKARATESHNRAAHARRTLAELEALPVTEAAQLIQDRAARAEAEKIATAASQARAAEPARWHSPSPGYPPGHERGIGPSL